eukprot:SAG11_NODE_38440_length_252_cov_0.679739_1_plen_28_part_10
MAKGEAVVVTREMAAALAADPAFAGCAF